MKFARYLQDTQTPEWKKAYIDYRGLKVQLGIIRSLILQQGNPSSYFAATGGHDTHHATSNHPEGLNELKEVERNMTSARTTGVRFPEVPGSAAAAAGSSGRRPASPVRRKTSNHEKPSLTVAVGNLPPPPRIAAAASNAPSQQASLAPRTPRSIPVFPFFRDSGSAAPVPLHAILANLPPANARFFEMLDAELDKVEAFYTQREKAMNERAKQLREQLNELSVHRQMFYQSSRESKVQSWTKKAHRSVQSALSPLMNWLPGLATEPKEPHQLVGNVIMASESGRGGNRGSIDASRLGPRTSEHAMRRSGDLPTRPRSGEVVNNESGNDVRNPPGDTTSPPKPPDDPGRSPPRRSTSVSRPRLPSGGTKRPLDPQEYQHAKRRLRRAVIEHYRGLEVLSNYRILNLTGFRKALKKYEKITKHTVLDAYMKEKIEPSAIASGAMVSTMLKEMEDFFTMRFERGDRKRAIDRLRVGPLSKTHHFSSFRSGWWLGLAFPAIAGGIYLSFQEEIRTSLPSWNILMFIYSILLMPVLMALLIGINIAVWARERINYVFIFELDPRSRLDHHEYFEFPSFLLCALAYAFAFSLLRIGAPMAWPVLWLALTLGVMFNPIRDFMWGRARWWTIKNIAKLGASGVWKVEFTDFWLGDQLTSLVYSLSNFFFVGCFYARFLVGDPNEPASITSVQSTSDALINAPLLANVTSSSYLSHGPSIAKRALSNFVSSAYDPRAQEAWSTCGTARNWGWYYLLGVLPLLVRFVQSLRRYRDSKLPTHLINGGKYGMGMIYYFFYFQWRHQENPHVGASYALWCFTAAANAIYGCTWDFLMDWSMLKPHARYPLLRPELVFKSQIPSYYFALISNLCIRFIWLIYVPRDGPNFTARTFIAALLEVLRRVQWNFYRLENEHLGNTDQYRVTREVPLPYTFDAPSNEEEHDDDDGDGEEEDGEEEAQMRQREQQQSTSGGTGEGEVPRTMRPKLKKRRSMMFRPMRNGGHG